MPGRVPVLLVLVDGLLGALLWQWQGIRIVRLIQNELAAGKLPAGALADDLLIVLAGALLITPGMLTDVVGFALLVPPLRAIVKRLAQSWFARHVEIRAATYRSAYSADRVDHDGHRRRADQVIDARVVSIRVEQVEQ